MIRNVFIWLTMTALIANQALANCSHAHHGSLDQSSRSHIHLCGHIHADVSAHESHHHGDHAHADHAHHDSQERTRRSGDDETAADQDLPDEHDHDIVYIADHEFVRVLEGTEWLPASTLLWPIIERQCSIFKVIHPQCHAPDCNSFGSTYALVLKKTTCLLL